MNASKARRRLMAWERYRYRARLLGAGSTVGEAHWSAWNAVSDRCGLWRWPWSLPEPPP